MLVRSRFSPALSSCAGIRVSLAHVKAAGRSSLRGLSTGLLRDVPLLLETSQGRSSTSRGGAPGKPQLRLTRTRTRASDACRRCARLMKGSSELIVVLEKLEAVNQKLRAPASEEDKIRMDEQRKLLITTLGNLAQERKLRAETELVIARSRNAAPGENSLPAPPVIPFS